MCVKIDLPKGGMKLIKGIEDKSKINMNLRIDEDLKNKFKIATIEKNTTMTEALISFMEEYIMTKEK